MSKMIVDRYLIPKELKKTTRYTEEDKIIINKASTQMGIVKLESEEEVKDVMKKLAFTLMEKQKQNRKFCPLCQAQLE